jgi:hypothetical protein
VGVGSVALIMLGMIAVSIVLELILPLAIKQRLGKAICWGMMGVTMTFLTLATIGLGVVLVQNVIRPMLGV